MVDDQVLEQKVKPKEKEEAKPPPAKPRSAAPGANNFLPDHLIIISLMLRAKMSKNM